MHLTAAGNDSRPRPKNKVPRPNSTRRRTCGVRSRDHRCGREHLAISWNLEHDSPCNFLVSERSARTRARTHLESAVSAVSARWRMHAPGPRDIITVVRISREKITLSLFGRNRYISQQNYAPLEHARFCNARTECLCPSVYRTLLKVQLARESPFACYYKSAQAVRTRQERIRAAMRCECVVYIFYFYVIFKSMCKTFEQSHVNSVFMYTLRIILGMYSWCIAFLLTCGKS